MEATAVAGLLKVYEEIDRQTAALKAMTELCCPPGCGACCSAPEAEATELEMRPVARELCRRQEALSWVERLGAGHDEGPCVFYQAERSARGEGGCGRRR